MSGKMMPAAFAFNNAAAENKLYTFKIKITQADGAEAAIFYNTSGYVRGFFDLWCHTAHGSIGWGMFSGQISRYGLNYTVNEDHMAYQNLAYVQKSGAANFNGIKVVRYGSFGSAPIDIYGRFYAGSSAGFSLYQSLSGTNTLNSAETLSRGV